MEERSMAAVAVMAKRLEQLRGYPLSCPTS